MAVTRVVVGEVGGAQVAGLFQGREGVAVGGHVIAELRMLYGEALQGLRRLRASQGWPAQHEGWAVRSVRRGLVACARLIRCPQQRRRPARR